MKIFVTGSTGFIGSGLVAKLASQGHTIHALYRSDAKLPKTIVPSVKFFKGDIRDEKTLENAMRDCDYLFHTAAFAAVWHRHESEIYRLNVDATLTILKIAALTGVKRCVVTSSAAVFGPSDGKTLSESGPKPITYFTPYERSKALMEAGIAKRSDAGQDIVLVNPTRLYGPGPLNDANSVTRLVKMYVEGKWHFLPGDGKSIGNYVYVDDVVNGHIMALQKGISGERYILGGENVSYNKLFALLDELAGIHYRLFWFPLPLILFSAGMMNLFAEITGISPMITPGLVRKYNHHWELSSDKAMSQLGYNPVSLREGLKATLQWLAHEPMAKQAL